MPGSAASLRHDQCVLPFKPRFPKRNRLFRCAERRGCIGPRPSICQRQDQLCAEHIACGKRARLRPETRPGPHYGASGSRSPSDQGVSSRGLAVREQMKETATILT
jgi:hypothetical protein